MRFGMLLLKPCGI